MLTSIIQECYSKFRLSIRSAWNGQNGVKSYGENFILYLLKQSVHLSSSQCRIELNAQYLQRCQGIIESLRKMSSQPIITRTQAKETSFIFWLKGMGVALPENIIGYIIIP